MADTTITLRVWRQQGSDASNGRFETFEVQADPDRDSVLDVVERAWAEHDHTIVFRHACHHAMCGTCTLLVDGRERLPCVTPLHEAWDGHSPMTLEPLRNVPVVADLAVDPAARVAKVAELPLPYIRAVEAEVRSASGVASDPDVGTAERFEDCLECLACVSACPVASGDPEYLGPAVLAAADRAIEEPRSGDPVRILDLVNTEHGIWQCRSIWSCSAVCPAGVDPAARIMSLRRRVWRGDRNGSSRSAP